MSVIDVEKMINEKEKVEKKENIKEKIEDNKLKDAIKPKKSKKLRISCWNKMSAANIPTPINWSKMAVNSFICVACTVRKMR